MAWLVLPCSEISTAACCLASAHISDSIASFNSSVSLAPALPALLTCSVQYRNQRTWLCRMQAGWYGNKLMAVYRAKPPRQRLQDCCKALDQDSVPPDLLAELQPYLGSKQLLLLPHTAIHSVAERRGHHMVTCATGCLHAQAAQQAREFQDAWGRQHSSSSAGGCRAGTVAAGEDSTRAPYSGQCPPAGTHEAAACCSQSADPGPAAPARGHVWSFAADRVLAGAVWPGLGLFIVQRILTD